MITKVSNYFALDKANGLRKVYKVPELMEEDGFIVSPGKANTMLGRSSSIMLCQYLQQ